MAQYKFLVLFVGFMVNFLLILGVNRLTGVFRGGIRCLLAALLGGLHTFASCSARFHFLSDIEWRWIVLLLTAAIAFGFEGRSFLCWVLFALLRFSMESLAKSGIWPALLFGAVIMLLWGMGKPGNGNFATVSILLGGKKMEITALLDTGNTLKDPITGLGVIVVDCEVAREILGLDRESLLRPVETFQQRQLSGLRLIPYSSVGQPSGMLLGMRVDRLEINGKKVEKIVAFAPQRIGQGRGFQALAGGNV